MAKLDGQAGDTAPLEQFKGPAQVHRRIGESFMHLKKVNWGVRLWHSPHPHPPTPTGTTQHTHQFEGPAQVHRRIGKSFMHLTPPLPAHAHHHPVNAPPPLLQGGEVMLPYFSYRLISRYEYSWQHNEPPRAGWDVLPYFSTNKFLGTRPYGGQ